MTTHEFNGTQATQPGQYEDNNSEESELASSDEYMDIKEDLLTALDGIQSSGDFVATGELEPLDPQIKVQDVGAIILPLQESQARQMIEHAQQAPYGRGSETLVDISVRNTLELNPDQFELGNPGWNDYIEQACAHVARKLGVNAPISAELYKMLIYEKGAMFKPHTDTEKAPGMFATLVIGLPSDYEGGEVVVKHQRRTFLLPKPPTQFWYAAWYSDVVHEILPVKSGYRWVLTYNLCLDPSKPRPLPYLQTAEARQLHGVIKAWLHQDEYREIPHAYYRLDHEYTQASISLNTLKGRDQACVQVLAEISTVVDVDVFLAVVEKEQHGSCDSDRRYGRRSWHVLDDVLSTKYTITLLVDLAGHQLGKDMRLDELNFLEGDCFDGVHPQEDYMGYMGNYGPEATHLYQVATLIIVPRDSLARFFTEAWEPDGWGERNQTQHRDNMASIVGYFAKSLSSNSSDKLLFDGLKSLCREIWGQSPGSGANRYRHATILPKKVITQVLQAAFRMKDPGFLTEAADRHEGELSTGFFKWVKEQFAAGDFAFDTIKDSLFRAIMGFPMLWKRLLTVKTFAPVTEPISDEVREWTHDVHDKLLKHIPQEALDAQDGASVVDIVPGYHDFNYLLDHVVPLVESRLPAPSFTLGFLSRLDSCTTKGDFTTADGTKLYRQVAKALVDTIDISTLWSEGEDGPPAAKAPRLEQGQLEPSQAPMEGPITPKLLAIFVSTLNRIDPDNELMANFSRQILRRAPVIQESAFPQLWIPFLHRLVRFCEDKSIPLSTPMYQQIFAAILKAYASNYVGVEPLATTGLVPRQVSCSCSDCRVLNDFLRDSSRSIVRFPVSKNRRHHLHLNIDMDGIRCSHVTDRQTYPETLVVTKIATRAEIAWLSWQTKRLKSTLEFMKFGPNRTSAMLGEENQAIANMFKPETTSGVSGPVSSSQHVTSIVPNQQAQSGPSIGISSQRSRTAVGRKRRASEIEVIDLTGE